MSKESHHLGEIARLFLKLGVVAFGGPAAHIAMLEEVDAVNICAVGLMLAVTIKLCASTLTGYKPIVILVGSLLYVLLKKGKANAVALVLGGGVVGYGLSFIRASVG